MTNYHDFTTIDTSSEERKKLGVGSIWLNRAKCKLCNDVVQSNNRHDFVTCKCGKVSVDGGSWYAKRCCNSPEDFEDMIVMYNDIKKDV